MESMRAVGYSFETALADLIDNSITADATAVRIYFTAANEPYVAVLDDGRGMSAAEAQMAMRLAGTNSRDVRSGHDLGRFGLGLKTASISQCREVTLVSKWQGEVHGFRWDLDYLSKTGQWSLISLEAEDCQQLPHFSDLDEQSSGTLVLWRKLDRFEAFGGDIAKVMDESMVQAKGHLGLVFHRFLAGEHGRPFEILVNLQKVEGADPLLPKHKSTQIGPKESIHVEGQTIELQSFTLPHLNKLSSSDRKRAFLGGSLRDTQGFYIYRAKRLVIWGTWFRVAPKQELGKLARVRVDVPNSLDHLWALDIKKAQAVPPPAVRTRLRQVADRIVAPSRKVHEFRGRKVENEPVNHLWDVIDDRAAFRYEVNRDHPAVAALQERLDQESIALVESLLRLLEQGFPVDDVYNRLGQDATHAPAATDDSDLADLAVRLWHSLRTALTPQDFVSAMCRAEPFDAHPNAETILKDAVNKHDS
ncbi:ATP-binding protein [Arthrobacter cupressi]